MFHHKKTIAGIMAKFEDTITELDTLNANASKDIDALSAQRDEIDSQIATAVSEGSKAVKIAASLRKLTQGEV